MWQQIWYYDGKIPCTIGSQMFSLKCGFGIGYGIGRKYPPIWVSVSVLDLNQNSIFCRTLCWDGHLVISPCELVVISFCLDLWNTKPSCYLLIQLENFLDVVDG